MVDRYELIEAGPPFTPLQNGLLDAADLPVNAGRWKNGLMRAMPVCAPAGSAEMVPCPPVTGTPFSPTVTGAPLLASDPFWVYAFAPCSPVGYGDDLADLRTRTESALTNGEARAVEHVVWTGQPTNGGTVHPHLAADGTVDASAMGANTVTRQTAATGVTSGATATVTALGLLEGALAECYGGQGVIHMPRLALPHFSNLGLLRRDGQQIRTWNGNLVAVYSSGDRHGPDGTEPAAGQTWVYATGAVQVYRSPIMDWGRQPAEFVGIRDNTTLYVAGRVYAVTWDCCHLAAQVNLGGT